MTMKGASRNERENVGVSVTPNLVELVGCSSVHYFQAIIEGTVAKVCNIDSHNRPPLRFRDVKAIYGTEEGTCIYACSSVQQQANAYNVSLIGKQVKKEMPSPKQCHSSCGSIEDSEVDDSEIKFANNFRSHEEISKEGSFNDITLKDLQNRCKAKKRKVLEFIEATEADKRSRQSRTYVQPMEIESDLQEPLSILKQKLSRNSIPERKQRKPVLSSPSKSAVQVKEEQEALFSSGEATRPIKYVETPSMPVVHGLSNINGDPIQFSDIRDEVSVADHCPIALDDADCSSSHLNVKSDFSVKSSSDMSLRVEGNELGAGQISSLAKNSPKCHADEVPTSLPEITEQSFGETARKDSTEIAGHMSSPLFVSVPNDSFQVKSLEPVYCVKNEILEDDSWDHPNAVCVTDWRSSGYVDESNHLGESSSNVLENADSGVFGQRYPTYPPNRCIQSFAQEVPTKPQEVSQHENYIEGMESSKMASHVHSHPLAQEFIIASLAPALGHGNEAHNDSESCKILQEEIACQTASQNDHSSVDDNGKIVKVLCGTDFCASYVTNEYIQDSIDEIAVQKGVNDNDNVYISIGDGEAPVDKTGALAREMKLFSKSFTNTLCTRSSCQQSISLGNLPQIKNCLPNTRKDFPPPAMEEASHFQVDKVINCSSKISHTTDVEGIPVIEAPETSSLNVNRNLSSIDSLLPFGGVSCKNEEKLSSPTAEEVLGTCGDKIRDHSIVASYSIDAERLKVTALKSYEGTGMEHQPKKLLSNRKSLSPTSQEKLMQATDAKEQLENGWSEKLTKDPPLSIPGHGETDVMLGPENMRRHPEIKRSGSDPRNSKGILKSPLSSCSNSWSCLEGSSVHKHAQRAIRFSQLQMHDIESIAMKLMKGLKSMRGIVEETLCAKACLSAHPVYTVDEIRVAVEDASELEETTKKWLSMLARDCNRFCKIMHRSTGVRKRRRKITFADEAGGRLCHVKVFHPTYDIDSETEILIDK